MYFPIDVGRQNSNFPVKDSIGVCVRQGCIKSVYPNSDFCGECKEELMNESLDSK